MRDVANNDTFALDDPIIVTAGCNIISIIAWLIPAILFTVYFWSIPCQGFRSPDCDFTFFLTFQHRTLMLAPLMIILMVVLFYYVLFAVKSRNARCGLESALTIVDHRDSGQRISRCYDKRYYSRTSFCTQNALDFEERRITLERISSTVILMFITFTLAWSPRLVWLSLSCVDGCPFPLFKQSLMTRSVIGLITEYLIILKSTIDPLIVVMRK